MVPFDLSNSRKKDFVNPLTTLADRNPSDFSIVDPEFKQKMENNRGAYLTIAKICEECAQNKRKEAEALRVNRSLGEVMVFKNSSTANNLEKQAKNLETRAKEIREANEFQIKQVRQIIGKAMDRIDVLSRDILNLIYTGFLDRSKFMLSCDNIHPLTYTLWVLEHLRAFRNRKEYDLPDDVVFYLDEIINEIKECNFIEASLELEPQKKNWTLQQMMDRITNLKPGQEALFNGGYVFDKFRPVPVTSSLRLIPDDNRLQYIFRRTDSGYSLIIVDTGKGNSTSGALELLDRTTEKEPFFDRGWLNIPREQITPILLNVLMQGRWSYAEPVSSRKIESDVEILLGPSQLLKERKHTQQIKKNSLMKPLMSWLHRRMVPSDNHQCLWKDFKIFFLERQHKMLYSLRPYFPETKNYPEFTDEVLKTLKRRKRKFEKGLLKA